MSKLLVVFGAAGRQGSSVIDFVLNNSALAKEYKIRALTRNPAKSDEAFRQKGVEVAKADFDDVKSIKDALQGAHTVFSMTASLYAADAYEKELGHGKAIADAAVAAGVKYYILSTVPSISKTSNGHLIKCTMMDVKVDIENYVRTLPLKSSFISPASFMQNYSTQSAPKPVGDGTYVLTNCCLPTTRVPLIDIDDTGKWVGAILTEPDKYEGKTLCAATRTYTLEEMVQIMSKASGKSVVYKQVPDEVFRAFFPPHFADVMLQLWQGIRDYGYYGADQEELLKWGAEQARGELTTLEEYFAKHPIHLE